MEAPSLVPGTSHPCSQHSRTMRDRASGRREVGAGRGRAGGAAAGRVHVPEEVSPAGAGRGRRWRPPLAPPPSSSPPLPSSFGRTSVTKLPHVPSHPAAWLTRTTRVKPGSWCWPDLQHRVWGWHLRPPSTSTLLGGLFGSRREGH